MNGHMSCAKCKQYSVTPDTWQYYFNIILRAPLPNIGTQDVFEVKANIRLRHDDRRRRQQR